VAETWHALPVSMVKNTALKIILERYWPGVTITGKIPASVEQTEITESESPNKKESMPPNVPGVKRTPLLVGKRAEAEEGLSALTLINSSRSSTLENPLPDITAKVPAAAKQAEITGRESLNRVEQVPSNLPETAMPRRQQAEAEGGIRIDAGIDAGEGIYIENAGLIILHPFLPQLFTALGISAATELLQPQRALCLLHFLTTGQVIAPEYELILPKILCNVPLETPVESDVELTDDERKEADALLEAVIRHWEVLRNTSGDGLRGTFLLRHGKVSLRDDGDWLLQVEAQSFDILLDRLPWGISMIKLPWMEKMLWVEWRQ
jgi:hypothetical protein